MSHSVADSEHWAQPLWMRSLATPCWPQMWSHDFSGFQAFIIQNREVFPLSILIHIALALSPERSRGPRGGVLLPCALCEQLTLTILLLTFQGRMGCSHPPPQLRDPCGGLESGGGGLNAWFLLIKSPVNRGFHLLFPFCTSSGHPDKLLQLITFTRALLFFN